MTLTADTNVLVRALVRDDKIQAEIAVTLLRNADVIILTLPCLCEFAWVLRAVYDFNRAQIAAAIERLCSASNVQVPMHAVETGLQLLARGGDFADGIIASEGRALGGDTFVSFDKKAVSALTQIGVAAELLG